MIELKFSGECYNDVLASCKAWVAQQEILGDELVNIARSATPVAPAAPAPAVTTYPQTAPAQFPTVSALPPAAVTAPAAPIPTAAPAYTANDLMTAGAQLMARVGVPAMQQLLARFGVQGINQVAPERYGEFAQALRDMGGTI